MSEKGIRIAVVVMDLFEALSAFAGAVGLVVGFMNIPVTVLSGTPFADFTVPALLLGLVVGGITVGYLTVEIAMIGLGAWPQVVWLLVGLVMIGLGALLWQAEHDTAHVTGTHQPV